MRKRVFDQLQMTRSSFEPWSPRDRPEDVADGHLEHGEVPPGGFQRLPCVTAAGLWATAAELASVFIEAQRALHGKSSLLSRETVQSMLESQNPAPPLFEGYGLGFVLEGLDTNPRFGHHGSNGFYKGPAVMHRDRGQGAIILTNGWDGFPLAEEILNAIARAYEWSDYRTSRRSRLSRADVRPHEGSYLLELGLEKRPTDVAFDEEELHLRIEGDDDHILYPSYPHEPGSFFILREGHPRAVRFERKNGRTHAFTLTMGPRALRAMRVSQK